MNILLTRTFIVVGLFACLSCTTASCTVNEAGYEVTFHYFKHTSVIETHKLYVGNNEMIATLMKRFVIECLAPRMAERKGLNWVRTIEMKKKALMWFNPNTNVWINPACNYDTPYIQALTNDGIDVRYDINILMYYDPFCHIRKGQSRSRNKKIIEFGEQKKLVTIASTEFTEYRTSDLPYNTMLAPNTNEGSD